MKTEIDFSKIGFIIGAGAHIPYGMPSSRSLTNKIKSLNHPRLAVENIDFTSSSEAHKHKKSICSLISKSNLMPSNASPIDHVRTIEAGRLLDSFLDAFAGSQVYSIDAYLAKYLAQGAADSTHVKIGKLLIAYFIAYYENETAIGYHEDNWIQWIINNHLRDADALESFFRSPPIIITLNYDRIFERSLLSHLIHYHNFTEEQSIQKLQSLKITHLYGDIKDFSKTFDIREPVHLEEAINRIIVVGEERKKIESNSDSIFDKLKNLHCLYLLGYGFDQINNTVLFDGFKKFLSMRSNTVPTNGAHPITYWPRIHSTNLLGLVDVEKVESDLKFLKISFRKEHLTKVDALKLISEFHPLSKTTTPQIAST